MSRGRLGDLWTAAFVPHFLFAVLDFPATFKLPAMICLRRIPGGVAYGEKPGFEDVDRLLDEIVIETAESQAGTPRWAGFRRHF